MKPFHQYWTFSAIRGTMTLVASAAIMAVPQAASSMLSIPVLIALAIDCLATYSLMDGAVMVLLAKLLPARAASRTSLYAQAAMVVVTGSLLYFIAEGLLGLRWLMWVAAAQAALAGLAELRVARDTHGEYGCLSCYSTAMVLGVAALCLPFAGGLSATGMSFALASYVGLYGASELMLGGRMLFVEYREGHPAAVASEAWRLEMLRPAAALSPLLGAGNACAPMVCEGCPAEVLCHDDSLSGQMARVFAERQPAVVRSMRVGALLKVPAAA